MNIVFKIEIVFNLGKLKFIYVSDSMEDDYLGAFEDIPEDEFEALSQSQSLSSGSEYDPDLDTDHTSQDSKVRIKTNLYFYKYIER